MSFGLGSGPTGSLSSRATAPRGSNDDQASNSEDQVASSRSSVCSIRSRLDSKWRGGQIAVVPGEVPDQDRSGSRR